MTNASGPAGPAPLVVLLRDGGWPEQPGVCCWRSSCEAAFTAAGATVTTATASGPSRPAVAMPQRPAWPPPPIRRRLAELRRRLRDRPAPVRPRPIPELTGASLVVAESAAVASAALAAGVPRHRVWALVLPPDRLENGDTAGQARELSELAARVGGLLTDSEPARESVEQAASQLRPRVELFPPIAANRACPRCRDLDGEPPADTVPELAQLALWRAMLRRPDRAVPYSFAAARLLGDGLAFVPASHWDQPAEVPPHPRQATGWTSEAQLGTARRVLDMVTPAPVARPRPIRSAVVAGRDLKFAVELAERLAARPDLDVAIDDWPTLKRGTPRTGQLLARADSIFAEWVRPSAVQLSKTKRPGQFLAVRLHRYELDTRYPHELAIDNVDAVVYIAPLFGRRIRDELGWPVEKLVYIPNYIDLGWLDRPKLPEVRFALGFVGIEFQRKRFDLALDLLARLREEDRRYTLRVRSVMPWQNSNAWERPAERAYAAWCFDRIERDPLLRDGVFFDPPGRDMARWFRRVGHILSTSDSEGCHTAVAEGMASGAVPVVRPWAGAEEIYDKEWIHGSTGAAAAVVLESADPDRWAERAARAKVEINTSYDPAAVVAAWADLLHGDLPAARRHFSRFAPHLTAPNG